MNFKKKFFFFNCFVYLFIYFFFLHFNSNKLHFENLQQLSLHILCSNLNINYKKCLKNSWQIPKNISKIIFQYYFEICYPESKEEIEFFNINNDYIDELIIETRHLKYLEIYSFINFNNLKKLKIDVREISLIDANFITKIIEKCSKLEEFFIQLYRTNENGMIKIYKALKPLSKTLKCIEFPIFYVIQKLSNDLELLLNNCSSLEKFHLNFCYLPIRDYFTEILGGLNSSTRFLRVLMLPCCDIDKEISKLLGNLLERNTEIEQVDFSFNQNIDISIICQSLLKSSKTLKSIIMADCIVNEEYCKELSDLLKQCSCIETIDLSSNRNIHSGIEEICNGLILSCNTLKSFNFRLNELKEYQCEYIKKLFENCNSMEKVYLSNNLQMENGFIKIVNSLKNCSKTLKLLDFGNCVLEETKCKSIQSLLKDCSNINSITVSCNSQMDTGFLDILQGLKASKRNLRYIGVSSCQLSEESCKEFGKFLRSCTSIEKVLLDGNRNMKTGFKEICDGLSTSSNTLKSLHVELCQLNENQSMNLAALLSKCYKIEEFGFNWNCRHESCIHHLCRGLANSWNTLKIIRFESRSLRPNTIKELKELIKICPKLQKN